MERRIQGHSLTLQMSQRTLDESLLCTALSFTSRTAAFVRQDGVHKQQPGHPWYECLCAGHQCLTCVCSTLAASHMELVLRL